MTGVPTKHYGSYKKQGHCDYWINCGHDQPNGDKKQYLNKGIVVNSHYAAMNVYYLYIRESMSWYVSSMRAYQCPNCGSNPTCEAYDNDSYYYQRRFMQCDSSEDVNLYVDVPQDFQMNLLLS